MIAQSKKNQLEYSSDLQESLLFTREGLKPVKLFDQSSKGTLYLLMGSGFLFLGGLLSANVKIAILFWPSPLTILCGSFFLWLYMHTKFKIPVHIDISSAIRYMRCKALRSFLIKRGYQSSDEVRALYSAVEKEVKMAFPDPTWHSLLYLNLVFAAMYVAGAEYVTKHAKPGAPELVVFLLPIVFITFIYTILFFIKSTPSKSEDIKILRATLWEILSDGYVFPRDKKLV